MRSARLAVITILFLSVLVLASAGCGSSSRISGKGTVRFVTLEGGFYGIVADNGHHYDPINLDEELQEDGLRVRFKAERRDVASIHMWGQLIEIVEIEKIGD
jgi:hypothetical protein